MKDKKSFNLRLPLAIWSFGLALFSFFGTIRCLPEFIHVLYHQGVEKSFTQSTYYEDIRLGFWYLIFVLSKSIELGDTFFMVLRKQKLSYLHVVHHVLTLTYCWFVYPDIPSTARWMVNMNYLIHTMMYTYFALRALQYRIPRWIAFSITCLQISQMIAGFYINWKSFQLKINGNAVDLSLSVATTGLALYSLFFILFINFLLKSYLIPYLLKVKVKLKKSNEDKKVLNSKIDEDCKNNNYYYFQLHRRKQIVH